MSIFLFEKADYNTYMRIQSIEQMKLEYVLGRGFDPDDIQERIKWLSQYKYSIIVEGEYMEFDNLDKWIRLHAGENPIAFLYYGKTGYDFGFGEYFMSNEGFAEKMKHTIPNIYTVYPNSVHPGHICKSDGYERVIDYDSSNKSAIIYPFMDKNNIPESLHHLIDLVSEWGIGDDGYRDEKVANASVASLTKLIHSIDDHIIGEMNAWLSDQAEIEKGSEEYMNYTSFFMAYEYAASILKP